MAKLRQESVGNPKDTTALTDILSEHHHTLVVRHLLMETLTNRLNQ